MMMGPPIAPLPDIRYECANEELFISLEKMTSGYPLPGNVITDINPFVYEPSNLPDGIWYLVRSKVNEPVELGSWEIKGEACILFSNSGITGWRTTLEFFEGKVPYEHKTDWLMHKYWITQKGLGENSKVKEASFLCRVFLDGEQCIDHKKQQKMGSLHIACENPIHSTGSIVPKACDDANGSSSKHMVETDVETETLAVAGEPPNYIVGNLPLPEIDYFSRGDYLELQDLDTPASPSSSSDNSSCLTMTSDERFDSYSLLQELDSKFDQQSQKEENCNLSVAPSFTPNEVIMVPPSPGSLVLHTRNNISAEERKPPAAETLGTDSPLRCEDLVNVVSQRIVRKQNADYRDEGPSNSHDVGTSSAHHLPPQDGKRKVAKGRMKKLKKKYMCFMPFYFHF